MLSAEIYLFIFFSVRGSVWIEKALSFTFFWWTMILVEELSYEKMQAMALSLFYRIPRYLVLTFFQKDEKRLHIYCIFVGSDGLHH